MENAAEALKIAFAVLLFVMALTLSISSFSQARTAVDAIISMRDRESQYTYVEPSENLSRIVGIDTVVSSMYRIAEQSVEIHFYMKIGNDIKPLNIYKNPKLGEINYIDLSTEGIGLGSKDDPNEFIDVLLGGKSLDNWSELKDQYEKYLIDIYKLNGLYNEFKKVNAEFEEKLGEYEIGAGASKITKRVITYILQP